MESNRHENNQMKNAGAEAAGIGRIWRRRKHTNLKAIFSRWSIAIAAPIVALGVWVMDVEAAGVFRNGKGHIAGP